MGVQRPLGGLSLAARLLQRFSVRRVRVKRVMRVKSPHAALLSASTPGPNGGGTSAPAVAVDDTSLPVSSSQIGSLHRFFLCGGCEKSELCELSPEAGVSGACVGGPDGGGASAPGALAPPGYGGRGGSSSAAEAGVAPGARWAACQASSSPQRRCMSASVGGEGELWMLFTKVAVIRHYYGFGFWVRGGREFF